MRVYAAELICSTGVLGFQTYKPVFCMYNKLRLHTEILSYWVNGVIFSRSNPLKSNRSVLNVSNGGPWNTKLTLKINSLWRKLKAQFSVFMWRHHIRKLKIIFPSEVSVPSDKRPYRTLTFHNVLARQDFSFCNRARLNFQAFALRDTKVAAQEGCRVGQKMSYRFSFC